MKVEELEEILQSSGLFYKYDNVLKLWQIIIDDLVLYIHNAQVEELTINKLNVIFGQQILQELSKKGENIVIH